MQHLFRDVDDLFSLNAILDILIIAVLLYLAILWLKERASRSLALAVLWLATLFLLANWLDLYLTTMFFRYGSVVILIAFVIVFQNDIRHGLERLATFSVGSWGSKRIYSKPIVDVLVEAVTTMANERIGALIVFPGREPLDLHVRGGVPVDAKISLPLLLSIFHPKSPGHDGAILVSDNRISHLGLHLPLTSDVERVRNKGTRHSAALGLAQCSDALIVVVSEERGSVSIARNGSLRTVEPTELATIIQQYTEGDGKPKATKLAASISTLVSQAAALLISISLWFAFAHQPDTVQRTFVVPVEYRNLPASLEIEEPKTTFAEVTLSGNEAAFSLLEPSTLSISLEVDATSDGQIQIWNTAKNLKNVANDLRVDKIEPSEVTATLHGKVPVTE